MVKRCLIPVHMIGQQYATPNHGYHPIFGPWGGDIPMSWAQGCWNRICCIYKQFEVWYPPTPKKVTTPLKLVWVIEQNYWRLCVVCVSLPFQRLLVCRSNSLGFTDDLMTNFLSGSSPVLTNTAFTSPEGEALYRWKERLELQPQ